MQQAPTSQIATDGTPPKTLIDQLGDKLYILALQLTKKSQNESRQLLIVFFNMTQ